MNFNKKNRRILRWKSTMGLVILLTMNVLGNKIYAQESEVPTLGFKYVCNEKIIVGTTNLEELEQVPDFWMDYLIHYSNYVMDREKLAEIGLELKNKAIKITAIIGSWCGDTREQLSVLQKILDNLDDKPAIEYIGVDRDKLAGGVDISALNIRLIPAFIFYENDQEIGRIVETPSSTMENDILRILRKEK